MDFKQLQKAAAVIHQGGVIAYPTESCFGLGCDPGHIPAVKKILSIKKRARHKGVILIADCYQRLKGYIAPLTPAQLATAEASWPGHVTWVCPAKNSTSRWLRGDHTSLAIRVSAHPIAAAICKTANTAIVSTSANIAGQPMLKSSRAVQAEFGDSIDFIVDGGIGNNSAASTIIDIVSGQVIR